MFLSKFKKKHIQILQVPTPETGAEKQKVEILLGSPLACAMRLRSYLQKARRMNRGIHEKIFGYVEKKTKLEGFRGY